jgi:hypothetical protein
VSRPCAGADSGGCYVLTQVKILLGARLDEGAAGYGNLADGGLPVGSAGDEASTEIGTLTSADRRRFRRSRNGKAREAKASRRQLFSSDVRACAISAQYTANT